MIMQEEMNVLTIVPVEKIASNPQTLLYNFPSMNPVRYTKLSAEYHYWRAVKAAEDTAHACGCLLVPGKLLHWRRHAKFADRKVKIGKESYFTMRQNELTAAEYNRFFESARVKIV